MLSKALDHKKHAKHMRREERHVLNDEHYAFVSLLRIFTYCLVDYGLVKIRINYSKLEETAG